MLLLEMLTETCQRHSVGDYDRSDLFFVTKFGLKACSHSAQRRESGAIRGHRGSPTASGELHFGSIYALFHIVLNSLFFFWFERSQSQTIFDFESVQTKRCVNKSQGVIRSKR